MLRRLQATVGLQKNVQKISLYYRLSKSEVDSILQRMPKLSKNDEGFFRGLGNKGLISFSEYLFLLTILIKPQVRYPCKKTVSNQI